MLTKKGIQLLVTLNNLIVGDGFVVLERGEISDAQGIVMSVEELNESLSELVIEAAVVVKMKTSNEVCLKLTALGRHRAEEISALQKNKTQVVRMTKDDNGETIIEINQDDNLPAPIPVEIKKVRRGSRPRFSRITSFVWGACGGLITSVAVILTYVYGFLN